MKSRFMRLFLGIPSLAIAISLGCGRASLYDSPAHFDYQDQVGTARVAVVSVARWGDVWPKLVPNFSLDATTALTQVALTSRAEEESFLDAVRESMRMQAGNAGGIIPTAAANWMPTASALPSSFPSIQPATAAAVALPIESSTEYNLALALYQQVQMLNQYLQYVTKNGGRPYLVTLDVALLPRRKASLDSFVYVTFQRAAVDGQTDDPPPGRVEVVPLIASDDMELDSHTRRVDELAQLSLMLQGYLTSGPLTALFGSSTDYLREALQQVRGRDINSLELVTRATEDTLLVRFGAHFGVQSQYALVPATRRVHCLMIVRDDDRAPDLGEQQGVAAEMAHVSAATAEDLRWIVATAHVSFDATEGRSPVIRGQSDTFKRDVDEFNRALDLHFSKEGFRTLYENYERAPALFFEKLKEAFAEVSKRDPAESREAKIQTEASNELIRTYKAELDQRNLELAQFRKEPVSESSTARVQAQERICRSIERLIKAENAKTQDPGQRAKQYLLLVRAKIAELAARSAWSYSRFLLPPEAGDGGDPKLELADGSEAIVATVSGGVVHCTVVGTKLSEDRADWWLVFEDGEAAAGGVRAHSQTPPEWLSPPTPSASPKSGGEGGNAGTTLTVTTVTTSTPAGLVATVTAVAGAPPPAKEAAAAPQTQQTPSWPAPATAAQKDTGKQHQPALSVTRLGARVLDVAFDASEYNALTAMGKGDKSWHASILSNQKDSKQKPMEKNSVQLIIRDAQQQQLAVVGIAPIGASPAATASLITYTARVVVASEAIKFLSIPATQGTLIQSVTGATPWPLNIRPIQAVDHGLPQIIWQMPVGQPWLEVLGVDATGQVIGRSTITIVPAPAAAPASSSSSSSKGGGGGS